MSRSSRIIIIIIIIITDRDPKMESEDERGESKMKLNWIESRKVQLKTNHIIKGNRNRRQTVSHVYSKVSHNKGGTTEKKTWWSHIVIDANEKLDWDRIRRKKLYLFRFPLKPFLNSSASEWRMSYVALSRL